MNKEERKSFREISKQLDHERGKDRIKFIPFGDEHYKSFVLFDGTEVSEGGWLIGRKWMTAKYMNRVVDKWVKKSFETRADNMMRKHNSIVGINMNKLEQIDKEYDLSAGCGQCGGCRWFATLDDDYGICFCEQSPNEGRITFEHAGCIQHSFIQNKLDEMENKNSE